MPEHANALTFSADSLCVDHICPSPNFGPRRENSSIDMVILHYTGMQTADGALKWLTCEDSQVSCHYFIDEAGRISQLVAEKNRAWHAGNSCWQGKTDINSCSIGIEIANPGHEFGYVDFPDNQMASVVRLVGDVTGRLGIPTHNVLAHSDIAPTRKEDPGERFDWQRLYNAGLAIWVEPSSIVSGHELSPGMVSASVKAFQENLNQLGFELEITGEFDELTRACTTAFQRRFRQSKVDGIGDVSTIETLRNVLDSVDSQRTLV